jgi:hypothetical protein
VSDKISLKTKFKIKKNKILNKIDLWLDWFRSEKPFQYSVGDKVFINNPDKPYGVIKSKRKVRPHINRYKIEFDNDAVGVPADITEDSILQKIIG